MWVIPADWWEPGRVWGCDSRDAAGETLTFFLRGVVISGEIIVLGSNSSRMWCLYVIIVVVSLDGRLRVHGSVV